MKFTALLFAAVLLCNIAYSQTNFEWARTVGGQLNDQATSVSIDPDGSVYFAGMFLTTMDADPGPGVYLLNSGTNKIRSYLIKLDSSGNFRWAYHFDFFIYDVHVDSNVYIAGSFTLTRDFDPGPGVLNLTAGATNSAYVSCFDTAGNFHWAVGTTGGQATESRCVITDPAGNVYAGGSFDSTNVDFDPGPGTAYLNTNGHSDGFIWKLDPSGSMISTARIGGPGHEYIFEMDMDAYGGFYLVGQFSATADLDPGPGTFYQTSPANYPSTFIMKLYPANLSLNWVKFTTPPICKSMQVDASGNVYYTGFFTTTVDFDPGPGVFNLTPVNTQNICVSKLDSAGNFVWALSTGLLSGNSQVEVDAAGNCYLCGSFSGSGDFDLSPNVISFTSNGQTEAFLCKLNPGGNFLWGLTYGNAGLGVANDIALDPSARHMHTVGYYENTVDFDPSGGVYNLTAQGAYESYVQKLGLCNLPELSPWAGSNQICIGGSALLNTGGNLNSATYWGLFTGGCNGTMIDTTTGNSFTVTPSVTTTYFIKAIDGCGAMAACDSVTITVNMPNITLAAFSADSICVNALPISLPAGNPAGGTYSGSGISGNTFDPALAGLGNHFIVYAHTDNNGCYGTDTSYILVYACNITGNENTMQEEILVYPNPATDHLFLENLPGDCIIQLVDVAGRIIWQERSMQESYMLQLPHSIAEGIYSLVIVTEKESTFKVFVVK